MTETSPPPHYNPVRLSPDEQQAVERLAAALGETDPDALHQIERLVKAVGVEFADDLLQQTFEVEAQGGIPVPDGSRRRTPGGVFFFLARKRLSRKMRGRVFFMHRQQASDQSPALPRFDWRLHREIIALLRDDPGSVQTAKVVLVGRPTRIQAQAQVAVLEVADGMKSSSIPKGVPRPPKSAKACTVFVGAKQWRKVADALDDPDDELIIEGLPTFHPVRERMAIYTTRISSKAIEKAVRLRQQDNTSSDR